MPKEYRGKLSKACEPCRARRSKCDQRQPTCSRCQKNTLKCHYRDLFALSFRDETATVVAKSLESGGVKDEDYYQADQVLDISQQLTTIDIAPRVSLDVMELAQNRWMYDYIAQATPGSYDGFLDYLPQMYARTRPGSHLDEALRAVSLANFHRRIDGRPGPKLAAYRSCERATQLVRVAVESADSTENDELLMAIFLLGIFETMSTGGNNSEFWEAHSKALAALVLIRPLPSNDPTGLSHRLFCTVMLQMLSTCLRLRRTPFISFLALRPVYQGCASNTYRLLELLHEAAELLAIVDDGQPTLSAQETASAYNIYLSDKLTILDGEIAIWVAKLDPIKYSISTQVACHNQPQWLLAILEHPGAPNEMDIFEDIMGAFATCLTSTLRIMLNAAQIRLRRDFSGLVNNPAIIQMEVQTLCRSVFAHLSIQIDGKGTPDTEFSIAGIRAYLLQTPLTIAKTCLEAAQGRSNVQPRLDWVNHVLNFITTRVHRPSLTILHQ